MYKNTTHYHFRANGFIICDFGGCWSDIALISLNLLNIALTNAHLMPVSTRFVLFKLHKKKIARSSFQTTSLYYNLKLSFDTESDPSTVLSILRRSILCSSYNSLTLYNVFRLNKLSITFVSTCSVKFFNCILSICFVLV